MSWCSIFRKMIFQWTLMWVIELLFRMSLWSVFSKDHWKVLILQRHVCRYFRLQSLWVGSRMTQTGTKHIFISTKGSQIISSLISTVFFILMESSVRNVRRKQAPDSEGDLKNNLVLCSSTPITLKSVNIDVFTKSLFMKASNPFFLLLSLSFLLFLHF